MKANNLVLMTIAILAVSLSCFHSLKAQGPLPAQSEATTPCVIKIGGKTVQADTHAILLPEQTTSQEKYAAEDLQSHLKLITGQKIPILKDGEANGRNLIVVGKSKALDELNVRPDWSALGDEGILIKTVGPHLILTGGKRGVLYACYTFLEDHLGIRWFARDCTVIPKGKTFDLPFIDRTYIPPLEFREVYTITGHDAAWSVRNKVHGHNPDPTRPGNIVFGGTFSHSLGILVPSAKYFRDHPEYFAEVDGKRQGGEHAQLCLANKAVEDIVVDGVEGILKANPSARIVSVSQNDTLADYCQCPLCKAVDTEEGSPSGSMLRFVNRVAERVEKDFPEVAILTYAYHYTAKAPKVTKPRHNVIAQPAITQCSYSQPIETGAQNILCKQDIEKWGKICNRIYVWTYNCNYRHFLQPFPNLRVLKPNIQFFLKNGVKGVFMQGNYTPSGEFDELRSWLLSKLLWNPNKDSEKLIDEFLAGYYGDAAPCIRQYIDLIHDSVERNTSYLAYSSVTAERPTLTLEQQQVFEKNNIKSNELWSRPFLTDEVIAQADTFFDQAEKTVNASPELLRRVKTARLPLLYMHIAGSRPSWRQEGDLLISDRNKMEEIANFVEVAKAAKTTRIEEGPATLDQWLAAERKSCATLHIVSLKNPSVEADILPELGGRIWRLRLLSTGKDLIKPYRNNSGFQADIGGYEEYGDKGYRAPGWNETYDVIKQDALTLTLAANLSNGFRLERSFQLDPDKPIISITSTLTNKNPKAQKACLRIHPVFAVADTQRAFASCKTRNGSQSEILLANPDDPKAQKDLNFQRDSMPFGEWSLVDETDGIEIVNRFRPAEVDKCYLNWASNTNRVNLEMWSLQRELKPGESLSMHHSYEITTVAASDGKRPEPDGKN